MKTISIRELHLHTGDYVRRAAKEQLVISDHGRQIALLTALAKPMKALPRRKNLPKIKIDSTDIVSADRDMY